jgi:ligand-binding sensor domain-containing protein
MHLFVSFVLLLLSFCSFGQVNSNIPVGAWRTHLPTNSITTLSILNNKIYAASTKSSFTYDIPDNYLASLSKVDGLTESSITVLRFNASNNVGMIGYSSGNLDVLKNGVLTNFDVIYRSTIAGSKKINNISIYNDVAFISCDFGVTVIDLIKNEIDESWLNLRSGGQPNKVYGCALNQNQDSVFLATEYGTMAAPYNKPGINLMDFTNWKVFTDISTTQSRSIGQLNGRMYAGVSGVGVFVLNGNVWQNIGLSIDATATCWNLVESNNKLLVCADNKVYSIVNPNSYTSVLNASSLQMVQDATYDGFGNLWFADQREGLVKTNGINYWWVSMNGPLNIATFNLYYYKNTILANSGGYSNVYVNTYNATGFYEFQNQEKWVNYFRYNSNYPDSLRDNINAQYNSFDDTLYIGHYGYGLVSFKKPNTFVTHDNTNSPLKSNRVTSLDVDSKGTLWMATFGVAQFQPSLYSKSKTGVWTTYTMNTSKPENRSLLQLRIDSIGNKWMRFGNNGMPKGLMVFNEKTNQERYFSNSSSGGNLPGDIITCVEIDKKGVVWVGSDQGIAGFYDPTRAFTASFISPIYNGFGVLFDKNITCIKTDGGNRKWVGTTEGLWLFNDNFSEAIHFFTVNNSPLYSNNIIAITIHEITGEVFIATDKGIISYRSDATQDNEDFSAAKIFPNPVRPGYTGVVTIEGLQDGLMVKVTDMQGKLFYESQTNGGTATWNLTNYAGIKAASGMYLVFATTENGQEKFVGKIAIIQ